MSKLPRSSAAQPGAQLSLLPEPELPAGALEQAAASPRRRSERPTPPRSQPGHPPAGGDRAIADAPLVSQFDGASEERNSVRSSLAQALVRGAISRARAGVS